MPDLPPDLAAMRRDAVEAAESLVRLLRWASTDAWDLAITVASRLKVFGDASEARVRELEGDIKHAHAEAKKYQPDYPWQLGTASEAVWACGQGYLGVCAANDGLYKRLRELETELASLRPLNESLAERVAPGSRSC